VGTGRCPHQAPVEVRLRTLWVAFLIPLAGQPAGGNLWSSLPPSARGTELPAQRQLGARIARGCAREQRHIQRQCACTVAWLVLPPPCRLVLLVSSAPLLSSQAGAVRGQRRTLQRQHGTLQDPLVPPALPPADRGHPRHGHALCPAEDRRAAPAQVLRAEREGLLGHTERRSLPGRAARTHHTGVSEVPTVCLVSLHHEHNRVPLLGAKDRVLQGAMCNATSRGGTYGGHHH